MIGFLSRQKKIFIITCAILSISLTSIFLIGEEKLKIDHEELKANILTEDQINTPQSEDFYRELLQTDNDEIFILKEDTTIQFASESWRDNFGYNNEDILNNNFFSYVHPKDLPFFANEILELVNNKEAKSNIGPFRLIDNESQYKLYMAQGVPLNNKDNEIIGIALILKDVSIPLGGSSGVSAAVAFLDIDLQ